MRPVPTLSAARLALLTLTGGAVTVSALIAFSLLPTHPHRRVLALAVVAMGFVLTIASRLRLSYSLKRSHFATGDVEQLRLNTSSTLWTALHYSLWVLSCIFLLVPLLSTRHHSLGVVGYAAMMLSSTMTMVKSALAKAPEAQPPLPAPAAPLSSTHWPHP